MRPVRVVVVGVDAQEAFEMAPSEDEDPIETVTVDGAHPALGERVRVRSVSWVISHLAVRKPCSSAIASKVFSSRFIPSE